MQEALDHEGTRNRLKEVKQRGWNYGSLGLQSEVTNLIPILSFLSNQCNNSVEYRFYGAL